MGRRRVWSKTKVLRELKQLHREGVAITMEGLRDAGHARLIPQIHAYCGGLKSARKMARIPPPKGKPLNKRETIAELRERSPEGESPRASDLPRNLQEAIRRHFGSIYEARRASGLEDPQRGDWSYERVLEELRELYDAGIRMTPRDLVAADRADLVRAVYNYVGTFPEARELAGIDAPEPKRQRLRLERDEVIKELKRLQRKHKRPLRVTDLPHLLRVSIKEHFGSMAEARDAADLDPARRWTEDKIIRELKRVKRQKIPVTSTGLLEAGRADLLLAIYRHLDGLDHARELAGIRAP